MRDLSNRGAGVNILKGLIGLGILNLPYASAQVGWLPSVIGMAAVAAMIVYGIFFAVMAKHKLEFTQGQKLDPHGGFAYATDVASPTLGPSPSPSKVENRTFGLGCFDAVVYEVLGTPGQAVWVFSVLSSQYLTGVAYITVIANSIENFVDVKPTAAPGPHRVAVLCAIGVVLVALSMVRRLRGIAYLSCAGLLVYSFVFVALLWECASRSRAGTFNTTVQVVRREGYDFGIWFGIISFSFGALPVALSVYDEMNKPQDFFKVTTWSFFICWVIYSIFGLLGYFCYGIDARDVVVFNFTEGSFIRYGAEISISTILLLTYIVQMVPVFGSLQVFAGEAVSWITMRTLTTISTLVVAYVIPDTVTAVTICGACAASVSCFLLPPVVFLRMQPPPTACEALMSGGLILLGGLVAVKAILFS